jgi:hypothetical protein
MSTPSQDSETDAALEAIAQRCDRCGVGDAPAVKRKGHTLARLCDTCAELLNPDTEDSDDRGVIASRKYRDEAWLRERYHEKEMTGKEIAELCGCSRRTIARWLDRHDIATRSRGTQTDPRLDDDAWLREQYQSVGTAKPIAEIARELDCSAPRVLKRLNEIGIDTSPGDPRLRDATWLRAKYHGENRTMYEIAAECGVSQSTVSYWFKKLDIETRHPGSGRGGS